MEEVERIELEKKIDIVEDDIADISNIVSARKSCGFFSKIRQRRRIYCGAQRIMKLTAMNLTSGLK